MSVLNVCDTQSRIHIVGVFHAKNGRKFWPFQSEGDAENGLVAEARSIRARLAVEHKLLRPHGLIVLEYNQSPKIVSADVDEDG